MLAPREIDEYLLPTERRVIRVRQHWAVMARHMLQTALFILVVMGVEQFMDGSENPAVAVLMPLSNRSRSKTPNASSSSPLEANQR